MLDATGVDEMWNGLLDDDNADVGDVDSLCSADEADDIARFELIFGLG